MLLLLNFRRKVKKKTDRSRPKQPVTSTTKRWTTRNCPTKKASLRTRPPCTKPPKRPTTTSPPSKTTIRSLATSFTTSFNSSIQVGLFRSIQSYISRDRVNVEFINQMRIWNDNTGQQDFYV